MNIEGVVLAAGLSSRANAFKLELLLDGKTVLERCVQSLYDACSRIIVVGGYEIQKVKAMMDKYPKVLVVFNESYETGMFSSVKKGMHHVDADRFFFTPGDYPMISPYVCQRLLEIQDDIVIPVIGGKKGHPILIGGSLAEEILRMPDTSNLRDFINQRGFNTVTVQDDGILRDLDTQEDYRQLLHDIKSGKKKNDKA
jgi:molybdenum cofactor cytidylyltransferase